jgi:alkanesulfonate monooxygenase SsuD/methylene tetrahydromethanopterin reductase-like flavin-dependent oxidoreductase (luciferase family)
MLEAVRVVVPDEIRGGSGLSPHARAVALALAETLFSTGSGPPSVERLTWLGDDLDHFFAHAGGRARAVFLLCITAIERVAPLFVGHIGRFSSMPRERRHIALTRFEASPAGLAFFGAKAALCIVWYEHPEAAREVGFDGLCLKRPA